MLLVCLFLIQLTLIIINFMFFKIGRQSHRIYNFNNNNNNKQTIYSNLVSLADTILLHF